jgi:hypothetical protein
MQSSRVETSTSTHEDGCVPTADDEHTPEQRCIIEARLADFKRDRSHGPCR